MGAPQDEQADKTDELMAVVGRMMRRGLSRPMAAHADTDRSSLNALALSANRALPSRAARSARCSA